MEGYDFYELPGYLGQTQNCSRVLMPGEIAGITVAAAVVILGAVGGGLGAWLVARKRAKRGTQEQGSRGCCGCCKSRGTNGDKEGEVVIPNSVIPDAW